MKKIAILKNTGFTLILLAAITGCAVQEMAMEEPLPPIAVHENPCMAEGVDSLQQNMVVGSVQRSASYILKGYTFYKDGRHQIEVPPEELAQLGLGEKDLEEYRNKLMLLNR